MDKSEIYLIKWKKLNPETSYYLIPIIWHSEKGKIIRNRKQIWLPGAGGWGGLSKQKVVGKKQGIEPACAFSEVVLP